MREYYDAVWRQKLSLEKYSTLERRWRTRWDFVRQNVQPRSLVLDVGCGDGILGTFLTAENLCTVFGVDISEYALKRAREKGVGGCLCDASKQALPFQDSTFDTLVMVCVLEHILNPGMALREAKRVVRTGGTILITLPNVAHYANRLSFLLGRTSQDFLHTHPGEGMHLQFYNYSDEFERRVLSRVPGLRITYKCGDFKNPRLYSTPRRVLMRLSMKFLPNLFAQYTHFVIRKEVQNAEGS